MHCIYPIFLTLGQIVPKVTLTYIASDMVGLHYLELSQRLSVVISTFFERSVPVQYQNIHAGLYCMLFTEILIELGVLLVVYVFDIVE